MDQVPHCTERLNDIHRKRNIMSDDWIRVQVPDNLDEMFAAFASYQGERVGWCCCATVRFARKTIFFQTPIPTTARRVERWKRRSRNRSGSLDVNRVVEVISKVAKVQRSAPARPLQVAQRKWCPACAYPQEGLPVFWEDVPQATSPSDKAASDF